MAISRTPAVPGLPALYLTMLACTIASIAVAHRDSSSEEVRELRWLGLCVLGIGVGLTCATAVWLALGRKWLVFRALAVLIACGISAWSIEQVFSQPTFGEMFCFLSLLASVQILLLLPLRRRGYGWRVRVTADFDAATSQVDDGEQDDVGERGEIPLVPSQGATLPQQLQRQFTLHRLFALVTIAALVFTALRWMNFPWEHAAEVLWLVVCFSLVAWWSNSAVLVPTFRSVCGCAVLLLIPLVGALTPLSDLALAYIVQSLSMLGLAFVMFAAGYEVNSPSAGGERRA